MIGSYDDDSDNDDRGDSKRLAPEEQAAMKKLFDAQFKLRRRSVSTIQQISCQNLAIVCQFSRQNQKMIKRWTNLVRQTVVFITNILWHNYVIETGPDCRLIDAMSSRITGLSWKVWGKSAFWYH